MKKSKAIHHPDWQVRMLKTKDKVVFRAVPNRKSYYYRIMRLESMVRYYRHRFSLIMEDRVVFDLKYPARYGWIAIDEIAKERITKISSL